MKRLQHPVLIIFLILLTAPFLSAQAIEDPGPHPVGWRDVTFVDQIFNQGTITAETFTLGIQNTGRTFTTTSGTLATPNGNLLQMTGGTVVFGSGTQLTGSGIYRLPVNTTLDLVSNFTLAAGDYQLELASETEGISVNGPGMLTVADTLVLGRDTINAMHLIFKVPFRSLSY